MARRAAPLPPDQRRAAIIAATIPLVRVHGAAVTTSQIALAAGLAEGTLFRVFPDKESLIKAAVEHACDPAPAEALLAALDRSLPLRELLIAAVEILQRRVEQIWQLITVLGLAVPPKPLKPPPPERGIAQALATLFEPYRDELRCDPLHAARLLRTIAFAGTHPRLSENMPLTAAEIVSVLLDGIRKHDEEDEC
ncbi:MAG TPA: TetR/AcrR family transcriptional regulator [Kofleriaceae bacterium]|nr:TetR/AcrR family transcriptional regulator [Kofleriaceae bacterium]